MRVESNPVEAECLQGISPREAMQVQMRLRDQVRLEEDCGPVTTVAGVDVRTGRGWKQGTCGIVVLSFPSLHVIETRLHTAPIEFPYVPGLLAFREIPIFLDTYGLVSVRPDVIFFDGQGYAHPRRFGLACHAGLALDKPSIGCAKSRLTGRYNEPRSEAGSTSPLVSDDGEMLGQVVRTRTGVKPVFVSPGHRVSFEGAVELTLQCTRGRRLPEPTRLAHELVTHGRLYSART